MLGDETGVKRHNALLVAVVVVVSVMIFFDRTLSLLKC